MVHAKGYLCVLIFLNWRSEIVHAKGCLCVDFP